MNAFASTDAKMVLAMWAYLQVLIQLLIEHHRAALRTFCPQTFRNLPLFGFSTGKFGFFGKRGLAHSGRWGDGRLSRFQPKAFLGEQGSCHNSFSLNFRVRLNKRSVP